MNKFMESRAALETRPVGNGSEDITWDFYLPLYSPSGKIPSLRFYLNYHGHKLPYLCALLEKLRASRRSLVWLAGDSSLDNKAWITGQEGEALNGYEVILDPPTSHMDVCYWVNYYLMEENYFQYACLNAAIEESSLKDRETGLLGQDCLIRDFMEAEDVLIVSLGGNDLALRPSFSTLASMAWLAYGASEANISSGSAWGLSEARRLFLTELTQYLEKLCSRTRPRLVILCMFYYPCHEGRGWADRVLKLLGEKNVHRLELIIDSIFTHCISEVKLFDGSVPIRPLALSSVLDARNPEHYVQRVEPSVEGGRLMGEKFVEIIKSL